MRCLRNLRTTAVSGDEVHKTCCSTDEPCFCVMEIEATYTGQLTPTKCGGVETDSTSWEVDFSYPCTISVIFLTFVPTQH